jgi:hypothetical protein
MHCVSSHPSTFGASTTDRRRYRFLSSTYSCIMMDDDSWQTVLSFSLRSSCVCLCSGPLAAQDAPMSSSAQQESVQRTACRGERKEDRPHAVGSHRGTHPDTPYRHVNPHTTYLHYPLIPHPTPLLLILIEFHVCVDCFHRELATPELRLFLDTLRLHDSFSANNASSASATRNSTRPKPPPVQRLINTIEKPSRRPRAIPAWTELCRQHQCICIECFRLFVADRVGVDFVMAPPELRCGALLPAVASIELGEGDDLTWVLCRNDYCIPARQRLLHSNKRGLQPGVLSPMSAVDQVSGLHHTGMHMPEGGEARMAVIEEHRYPHLRVDTSTIPRSGRGVFACRELQPGEIVCSVVGQIRMVDEKSTEPDHPLSLDIGSFNGLDHVYGFRLFRQGVAGIINSSLNLTTRCRTPNCIFTEHPHFKEQEEHYLGRSIWPSGAMCVMVKEKVVVRGQELFIAYKWGAKLWTKQP